MDNPVGNTKLRCFVSSFWVRTMNFLHDKDTLLNLTAAVGLTVVSALYITNHNLSAGSEPVPFVSLTNSDIDTILAVKAEMQDAKIQANLGNL